MSKDNVFDRLVKDLSSDERRKMMQKMEENIHVSSEPLDNTVESESIQSIEEEYKALSWLDKLLIFLQSLFLAKDRQELTKKYVVRGVARQLAYISPDLIDVKHEALTGEFCKKLQDIEESAGFIKHSLSVCFGIDKSKFYALMGQLEFQQIHDALREAVDPLGIARKSPNLDAPSIRRNINDNTEALLARIGREDRMRMVETTRTLNTLYQISLFPYSTIISQFPDSPDGSTLAAGFSSVKEPLSELAAILKAFRTPPSIKLLEAVFLLYYSDDEVDESGLDEKIAESITRCNTLFQKIRDFNSAVPLSDLMKVIYQDPFYAVPRSGGGEDWFYFYRQYWMDTLTEQFRIFSRELKIEEIAQELQRYWDLPSLIFLPGYTPRDQHTAFSYSMAAMHTFFEENYQKKLYYPMKIILVDGSFYKKNNREDFEKTFQILVKFGDRIKWFTNKLAPEGDTGAELRKASHELREDPEALDKQILIISNRLNRDAQLILEDAIHCLEIMGKLMNGVVMGNGGAYDTLSNFSELGGRNNEELRQNVTECADDIHKITNGLKDLFNLEKEKLDEMTREERESS
ncbi:MAG: DUF5312 family protein [Spirochaetales bacterium]|nr:DUF5312 family protein [Spirochaetales bacterium]